MIRCIIAISQYDCNNTVTNFVELKQRQKAGNFQEIFWNIKILSAA